MCGRYSLTTAPEALRQLFNFDNLPNLAPRYNIAPTQDIPVIRPAGRGGGLFLFQAEHGLGQPQSFPAQGDGAGRDQNHIHAGLAEMGNVGGNR